MIGVLVLMLVSSIAANGYLYWQQRQLQSQILDLEAAFAGHKIDAHDRREQLSSRMDQVVNEARQAGKEAVEQQVTDWAQQTVREGLPGRIADLEDRVDELTAEQSPLDGSYLAQCVKWLVDHDHSVFSYPPSACRLIGLGGTS